MLDGHYEEIQERKDQQTRSPVNQGIAGLGLEIERAREDPAVGLSQEFEP